MCRQDFNNTTSMLQRLQERRRKWDGFASGEALFGLPVTAHPELQRTAEELSMLGRLYGLYRSVIDTIRSYGDYLWSNVVSQVSHVPSGMVAGHRMMGITLLRYSCLPAPTHRHRATHQEPELSALRAASGLCMHCAQIGEFRILWRHAALPFKRMHASVKCFVGVPGDGSRTCAGVDDARAGLRLPSTSQEAAQGEQARG